MSAVTTILTMEGGEGLVRCVQLMEDTFACLTSGPEASPEAEGVTSHLTGVRLGYHSLLAAVGVLSGNAEPRGSQ